MENLSDPGKLGAGIAVAFVATVYGVGSANLLFLPMATKLEVRHRQVMILNEMILEGVVALSTGENPRLIEEKLTSFLSDLQKEKRSTSVSKAPAGAAAGKTLQEESG
jgi:chemotaxis protein MotA